jgi:hypothetical protein
MSVDKLIKKIRNFLGIAFVLFVIGAMTIPTTIAIWEGNNDDPVASIKMPKSPSSSISDHANDGGSWLDKPTSGSSGSAADEIIASFKKDIADNNPKPGTSSTRPIGYSRTWH